MVHAELRFWSWITALLFWSAALIHYLRAAPLLTSKAPDQAMEFYVRVCRSYWCYLRGAIVLLVGYILTFHQSPNDWRNLGLIIGGIVLVAFLWRHARHAGKLLLDRIEASDEPAGNSPT